MSDVATVHGDEMRTLYHLPYETDAGIAERAAIGVIVLATDQTVEHEFRVLLDMPGVAFYESRIWNDGTITPDTLRAMDARIEEAARLILPGQDLDVMAFGCTSASMVIGEAGVFEKIARVRPGIACTTPITAAFAAFGAFGARRIGVLTPYRDDVNQVVRDYIESKGFTVPVFGSFNEENDAKVARISRRSLIDAIDRVRQAADIDALFVSCTSVRLAECAHDIEAATGLPVTSSNHAMAWHCLRLAGVTDERPEFGRLFALQAG
jgi:maleate isomerase